MVHYTNISYRLGSQNLLIDPKTEEIGDNADAMKLFKREYRQPTGDLVKLRAAKSPKD